MATVVFAAVDADAVLHRHRHRHRVAHRLHALGDELRLGHQAGSERAALNPLARAAAVEVHEARAALLCQLGAVGQGVGVAVGELRAEEGLVGVMP